MTCCSAPRKSIVKRWTYQGKFYTIERCRRCHWWGRRVVDITLKNGQFNDEMYVTKLEDGTKDLDNSEQTNVVI